MRANTAKHLLPPLIVCVVLICLVVLNTIEHEENQADNETAPVRHFVFHALHKTGSKSVRMQLRLYCYRENLSCFTNCECGVCPYVAECFAKYKVAETNYVERGSYTVARMRDAGCCHKYEQFVRDGLDGIIEHLPLYAAGNREFVEAVSRPDAFRFTMLRDPVDQFLSYYSILEPQFRSEIRNLSLDGMIDLFWDAAQQRSLIKLPLAYHQLHYLITNSQSKELGWTGVWWDIATLNNTLDYMRSLNFIGFAENLMNSWKALNERLHWPEDVYFVSNVPPGITEDEAHLINAPISGNKKRLKEKKSTKTGEIDVSTSSASKTSTTLKRGERKKIDEKATTGSHQQNASKMRENLTEEQIRRIREIQFADVVLHSEAKRIWGPLIN